MTLNIKQGVTIVAFSNGNENIIYGLNAQVVSQLTGRKCEQTARGTQYMKYNQQETIAIEARVVAKGYKIAYLEA